MIEYTNEQLCEHIKKGEKWATERLIEQNKGFVFDCAHKTYKAYRVSCVLSETDEDDLLQEGLCALIAAVDSFDPTRGTLFLTYSGHAIQNAMLDWLRENNKRFELKYLKVHPDFKWEEYDAEAKETAWQPIDMPNDPYTMTPEQIYLRKETGEMLEAGLEKCGLRGREYLMYRYGFIDGHEHTETETARRYHLKRSWARKIEDDSLNILKQHLIEQGEYHKESSTAKQDFSRAG